MTTQASAPGKGRTSFIVFILIVAALFIVYSATTSTELRNKELVDKTVEKVDEFSAEQKKKEKELQDENKMIMRNQQVYNRQSWETFSKDVETFRALSIELKQLQDDCSALVDRLLTSPEGRSLAQSPNDQKTFIGIQEVLQESAPKHSAWETVIEGSATQVKNMFSLTSISTPVERNTRDTLAEAYASARKLLPELKSAKLLLTGYMQQGASSLAQTPPSNLSASTTEPGSSAMPPAQNLAETLQQQSADQVAQFLLERQNAVLRIRSEAEAEIRASLGVLEKEKAQLEGEIERARLDRELAELREKARLTEEENLAFQREAERKKIEREEDRALAEELDRVKALLSPFIAKSKSRISQHLGVTYAQTEEPMSLAMLEGVGALRDGEVGAFSLKKAAAAANEGGRPLGAFPMGVFLTPENYEAQQLLSKHKRAMVRAGLLLE